MKTNELFALISGGIILGDLIIGLFFWRFWRQTRDRLFIFFALAFGIFAIERVVLATGGSDATESRALVYLFRLAAFLIIIGGILDKNRRKPSDAA